MAISLNKENLRRILEALAVILIVVLTWLLWASHKAPGETPQVLPKAPLTATSSTTVNAVPKSSPSDNDVEITHTYTAIIDGKKEEIPFKPQEAPNGVKGVIKQEIDFTPIVQKMADSQIPKWSLGAGIGVHKGDLYIPIEAERVLSKHKAIAVELHIAPEVPPKVNGGEVKVKWRL